MRQDKRNYVIDGWRPLKNNDETLCYGEESKDENDEKLSFRSDSFPLVAQMKQQFEKKTSRGVNLKVMDLFGDLC